MRCKHEEVQDISLSETMLAMLGLAWARAMLNSASNALHVCIVPLPSYNQSRPATS